jgi:hypothetical protein
MTRRTASELLRDRRALRSRRIFPASSMRLVRVNAAPLTEISSVYIGLPLYTMEGALTKGAASLSGGRNWLLTTGDWCYANLTFTSGFFSR